MITHRTGDIFTSTADAVGHGVNCRGVMGAGIALQFRNRYPRMYAAYRRQCEEQLLTPGGMMVWPDEGYPVIYNIASQDVPGANAKLPWLDTGVRAAVADCEQRGLSSLALPQIGCGIGGLSWPQVTKALEAIAESTSVRIEAWTYQA